MKNDSIILRFDKDVLVLAATFLFKIMLKTNNVKSDLRNFKHKISITVLISNSIQYSRQFMQPFRNPPLLKKTLQILTLHCPVIIITFC